MTIIKSKNIQNVYKKLIKKLINKKALDEKTKEIENCCLIVKDPSIDNIYFPYRNISEKYTNAELKWYWHSNNDVNYIGQYAKMWYYLSDDGVTNNSAYGYILFKKYGFNQLEQIISLLKDDKNSRRAILNISDPTLNRIKTKDLQCTIAIQFLIRNEGLEETIYMRSNDVYFGLPYDYIFFVTLGKYVAKQLNLKLTKYIHHSTSMHMYLKDLDKFKKHKANFKVDYWKIIGENYEK